MVWVLCAAEFPQPECSCTRSTTLKFFAWAKRLRHLTLRQKNFAAPCWCALSSIITRCAALLCFSANAAFSTWFDLKCIRRCCKHAAVKPVLTLSSSSANPMREKGPKPSLQERRRCRPERERTLRGEERRSTKVSGSRLWEFHHSAKTTLRTHSPVSRLRSSLQAGVRHEEDGLPEEGGRQGRLATISCGGQSRERGS